MEDRLESGQARPPGPREPGHTGLRLIALFELAKGLLVLLAGFGALALIHRDVQALAERLVRLSHLNPAHHYPRIFVEASGRMTDARLWLLWCGAAAYSAIRFLEAYGLWRDRTWAEWLAVLSASLYVPLEVVEIVRHVTAIRLGLMIINLAIIFYLVWMLAKKRRHL